MAQAGLSQRRHPIRRNASARHQLGCVGPTIRAVG